MKNFSYFYLQLWCVLVFLWLVHPCMHISVLQYFIQQLTGDAGDGGGGTYRWAEKPAASWNVHIGFQHPTEGAISSHQGTFQQKWNRKWRKWQSSCGRVVRISILVNRVFRIAFQRNRVLRMAKCPFSRLATVVGGGQTAVVHPRGDVGDNGRRTRVRGSVATSS